MAAAASAETASNAAVSMGTGSKSTNNEKGFEIELDKGDPSDNVNSQGVVGNVQEIDDNKFEMKQICY